MFTPVQRAARMSPARSATAKASSEYSPGTSRIVRSVRPGVSHGGKSVPPIVALVAPPASIIRDAFAAAARGLQLGGDDGTRGAATDDDRVEPPGSLGHGVSRRHCRRIRPSQLAAIPKI